MAEAKSDILPLAEMNAESDPLLSNNEEPTVGASSFENDDVESNIFDTTTTASPNVENTADIVSSTERSDSQGLFRTKLMTNIRFL